jgi:hypothetical protein
MALAMLCRIDFDSIAAALNAKPEEDETNEKLAIPKTYRTICLRLSSGRTSILTNGDWKKSLTEISLEVHRDNFFHEADKMEIAAALGVDVDYFENAGFGYEWIPYR